MRKFNHIFTNNTMTLTREQRDEMERAAIPLLKWMNENCDPHCKVTVDQSSIHLSQQVCGVPNFDYVKD